MDDGAFGVGSWANRHAASFSSCPLCDRLCLQSEHLRRRLGHLSHHLPRILSHLITFLRQVLKNPLPPSLRLRRYIFRLFRQKHLSVITRLMNSAAAGLLLHVSTSLHGWDNSGVRTSSSFDLCWSKWNFHMLISRRSIYKLLALVMYSTVQPVEWKTSFTFAKKKKIAWSICNRSPTWGKRINTVPVKDIVEHLPEPAWILLHFDSSGLRM